MIASLSLRAVIKHAKLWIKIIVLAIVILYILPKLLNLFWNINNPGQKIREEHLLEKPLRVMETIVDIG